MSRLPALVVSALVLSVALTSCSRSVEPTSPSAPSTPKVSLSDATSAPAKPQFDDVLEFVKTIYLDQEGQSGQYVADNTTAARYVAHQVAVAQVNSNYGNTESADPAKFDFDDDEASNTVTVESRSGDKPVTYVWNNFQFARGKISSWQIQGKPMFDKRLWHSRASDQSKGVTATLVSAYEDNGGDLTVVLDLASKEKNVRIIDATYTPPDGYRHQDAANLSNDVDEQGKTLTYFTFNKSQIGGRVKLSVDEIDADDETSSTSLTSLTFKVA